MSNDNPFRDQDQVTYGPNGEVILPADQRRGMVGHVPIVGSLLIMQGALEIALGCAFLGMALFGKDIVAQMATTNPVLEDSGWTPEQVQLVAMALYGVFGVGLFILAAISIFAGWKTLTYQNRTLGIVGSGMGFAALIFGCYCFPTGMLVGIYGLVVLQNEPVKAAFELGKAGYKGKQIKEIFKEFPP